jgi:hypothetical protein
VEAALTGEDEVTHFPSGSPSEDRGAQ